MKKTLATIGLGALAFTINSIEANAMEQGTVNTSVLNIRNGPSTDYNKIDKAYKGNVVQVLEKSNGWYKVKLTNGKIGWASGQYINLKSPEVSVSPTPTQGNKGKIIANPRLNIRSGPDTSYSIKAKANYGEVVEIIEKANGWYKVKLKDGTTGWGSSDYIINITSTSGSSNSNNQNNNNSNNIGQGNSNGNGGSIVNPPENIETPQTNRESVVKLCYDLIGTPYGWGGNGPENFDCSGFTRYVYSNAEGKTIPRVSKEQAVYGIEVGRDNFLPGDLVYFDTDEDGVINHVGIYVGNNEFIHASGTPTQPDSVKKENLKTSYWTKVLVGARRF